MCQGPRETRGARLLPGGVVLNGPLRREPHFSCARMPVSVFNVPLHVYHLGGVLLF